ncbi:MAG: hypothetical protein OHK0038_11440 [Flammeovirgaceae bacterium]
MNTVSSEMDCKGKALIFNIQVILLKIKKIFLNSILYFFKKLLIKVLQKNAKQQF